MLSFHIEGEITHEVRPLREAMRLIARRMYESQEELWKRGFGTNKAGAEALKGRGVLRATTYSNYGDDFAEMGAGRGLEYAMILQKGGVTHPNKTERMERFFWAKFGETGEEKWKWMALSRKKQFTISIPGYEYVQLQPEDWVYIYEQLGNAMVTVSTSFGSEPLYARR